MLTLLIKILLIYISIYCASHIVLSFVIDLLIILKPIDRRSQDLAEIEKEKGDGDYETIYEQTDGSTTPPSAVKSSDHVTRIYACATMWHENKEEMMEFLKSILRLDEDQCARRVAQKYLKVVDPDYYEFEST